MSGGKDNDGIVFVVLTLKVSWIGKSFLSNVVANVVVLKCFFASPKQSAHSNFPLFMLRYFTWVWYKLINTKWFHNLQSFWRWKKVKLFNFFFQVLGYLKFASCGLCTHATRFLKVHFFVTEVNVERHFLNIATKGEGPNSAIIGNQAF